MGGGFERSDVSPGRTPAETYPQVDPRVLCVGDFQAPVGDPRRATGNVFHGNPEQVRRPQDEVDNPHRRCGALREHQHGQRRPVRLLQEEVCAGAHLLCSVVLCPVVCGSVLRHVCADLCGSVVLCADVLCSGSVLCARSVVLCSSQLLRSGPGLLLLPG